VIRVLGVFAAAVALAGCGGGDDAATETTGHEGETVVVYFLRDGQVWPVEREIHTGDAIDALYGGPTDDEASELELTTELPEDEVSEATVAGSVATVEAVPADLSNGALAQIVYTLTRDAAVRSVDVRGESYTRADFEAQTPSVLVESPLAFRDISSPLTARGTANTFEATFSFEILDESGEVIAGDFVTATSGTGTRGTFRFEQPFVVEEEQDGVLRIFELSAEDGSRMNEVEIPVRLLP
jgi:germination protein M